MEKIKIVFSKQWSVASVWIRKNPKEFQALILILLVGAFLRLYRIGDYMTFLGDEGRDVILVRRLLVDFDLILVGPGTSIGNMYLGPLYYYMMAPALLLFGFSPVGPAVQIAVLGVLTIFLVWFVAREWFGNIAALVASSLYAIAPTIVIYSRSSWNPNIMPIFALLTVYLIWRAWKFNEIKWLVVIGITFAFVMQSHYLGLLLAPVIGLYWLFSAKKQYKKSIRQPVKKRKFNKYTLGGLAIFSFLMSPLLIFDVRHGWNNFAALKKFFLERQTTVSARPWNALPNTWPNFVKIITRLLAGGNEIVGFWLSVGIVLASFWLFVNRKLLTSYLRGAYSFLIVWLGFALLGLGVYKQEIYDHYYGFFFAAPFILLGGLAENIFKKTTRSGKMIMSFGLLLLVLVNLLNSPIKGAPNEQLARAKNVAKKIKLEANGARYNLAVVAERNYEDGYQYFLEKWGEPVIDIDAQRADETITDQLFVVCELPPEKCDPSNSPKAEVANFGWTVIENQWEVFGVTLYKLIHTQEL